MRILAIIGLSALLSLSFYFNCSLYSKNYHSKIAVEKFIVQIEVCSLEKVALKQECEKTIEQTRKECLEMVNALESKLNECEQKKAADLENYEQERYSLEKKIADTISHFTQILTQMEFSYIQKLEFHTDSIRHVANDSLQMEFTRWEDKNEQLRLTLQSMTVAQGSVFNFGNMKLLTPFYTPEGKNFMTSFILITSEVFILTVLAAAIQRFFRRRKSIRI